jgi:phage major head subunit gpT-like protein
MTETKPQDLKEALYQKLGMRTSVPLAQAIMMKTKTFNLREALTTSEMSGYFNDVVQTLYWTDFAMVPTTYQDICEIRSNKAPHVSYHTSEMMGELPEVGEKDEYGTARSDLGDEVIVRNKKYGDILKISEEAIMNDDIGELNALIQNHAQRAAVKPEQRLASVLETAANFNAGAGLTGSTALSATALKAAYVALTSQKENNQPLAILPSILVVPSALELTAAEILDFPIMITGEASTRTNGNVLNGRLNYVVNRWLTDANNWYLLQPKRGLKLNNQIGPDFIPFNNGQSYFMNDCYMWKIRWAGHVAVADNRFMFGSFV